MLKIGDNFDYQGQKPNFARDTFSTLSEMKAYPETSIDEGHISFCIETGKLYQYKKSNSIDSTNGKWKLLIDTVLDANSENPVQNKIITNVLSQKEKELLALVTQLNDSIREDLETNNQVTSSALGDLKDEISIVNLVLSSAINELREKSVNTELTINGYPLTGPITLTKSDVGLNAVDNTSDLNKPISSDTQKALDGKVDKTTTINGHALSGNVIVSRSDIGLGNVENTSDLDKPISNKTQDALNEKVDKVDNKSLVSIDEIQKLESYPEYSTLKTSIDTATSNSTSASTAITGHIQDRTNPHSVTKSQVGLGNADNTSDLDKPISNKTQEALDKKADKSTVEENEDITSAALGHLQTRINDAEKTLSTAINSIRADLSGIKIWVGSQTEYDSIATKDNLTLYIIV